MSRLPGGAFRFQLSALTGDSYRIDVSSDLATWTPLTTLTPNISPWSVDDAAAAGMSNRFYRTAPSSGP